MGEAKRRKAAISVDSTVVPIATLVDPVASLRRFLDKMPDERIASRFDHGADRAKTLEFYQKRMTHRDSDLFVAREGQEIFGIFEGNNHGRRLNPCIYEVSLLCMPGYADALIKYARKVRPPPTYLFVGTAMEAYSVPIHKFMMHHLDMIMLTGVWELQDLVLGKIEEGTLISVPMVSLWERHPRSSDPYQMPPLNSATLMGVPLTSGTVAMARLVRFVEVCKLQGLSLTKALEAATKIVHIEKAQHEYRRLHGCSLREAIERTCEDVQLLEETA